MTSQTETILPDGWGLVRLEDALSSRPFRVGKIQRQDYLPTGAYPVVDQGKELIAGYCDDPAAVYDGPLPVIVFGDHTRVFKFVDFRFVCGADGTKVLVPKPELFDPAFMFYALLAIDLPSRGYNRHYSLLREKTLPQPPLYEQKAIAAALGAIDHARVATALVVSAARRVKQAMSQHLFAHGPVTVASVAEVETRETAFGIAPGLWRDVEIQELAQVRAGQGFPPERQGQKSGRFPFFKVSDMNLPGNQVIMTMANNYVDDATVEAIKGKPMPARTVVFPKVGAALATNKKRILGVDGLVDNNVMGVTVTDLDRCSPEFLHRWFESIDLVGLSNPGPLPSINAGAVKQATVPLPSPQEQEQIVRVMDAVDRKIRVEEQREEALTTLFGAALRDLLSSGTPVGLGGA